MLKIDNFSHNLMFRIEPLLIVEHFVFGTVCKNAHFTYYNDYVYENDVCAPVGFPSESCTPETDAKSVL